MTGAEEAAWDNFEELKRFYEADWSFLMHAVKNHHIKQLIRDIKRGRIKITPEFMRSLKNPELKKIVIEAICLARI